MILRWTRDPHLFRPNGLVAHLQETEKVSSGWLRILYYRMAFKSFEDKVQQEEWFKADMEAVVEGEATATPWDRDLVGPNPTAAVIFLHGEGDTGAGVQAWLGHVWEGDQGDFEETVAKVGQAKVLFPSAPVRPFGLHGGHDLQAWFNRDAYGWSASEDLAGLEESRLSIEALVDDLVGTEGVAPENIFIGGFAMGGEMALQTVLRSKRRLGGCFAMASYLPRTSPLWVGLGITWHEDSDPHSDCKDEDETRPLPWTPELDDPSSPFRSSQDGPSTGAGHGASGPTTTLGMVSLLNDGEATAAGQVGAVGEGHKVAVQLQHGAGDEVVDWRWGKLTAEGLDAAGLRVDWQIHSVDHQLNSSEVAHLVSWLTRHIDPEAKGTATAAPGSPGDNVGSQARGTVARIRGDVEGAGRLGAGEPGTSREAPGELEEKGTADNVERPGWTGANRRNARRSRDTKTGTSASSTGGTGASGEGNEPAAAAAPVPHQPYRIKEARGGGTNMHTAVFAVPKGFEEALARFPVTTRGAQFDLQQGRQPGTVEATFYSSDPDGTATAIGQRLSQRVKDPAPPGAEDCIVM